MRATALRVRRMEPADVPEVSRVESASFSAPWSPRTFKELGQRGDPAEVWVAADDQGLAGYAVMWCVADQAELANLAVDADRRRSGVARALLDRVLERSRELGAESIFLEVRASNEPAVHLYRSAGFREVGLRKRYYSRPTEDAVIMMRPLEGV